MFTVNKVRALLCELSSLRRHCTIALKSWECLWRAVNCYFWNSWFWVFDLSEAQLNPPQKRALYKRFFYSLNGGGGLSDRTKNYVYIDNRKTQTIRSSHVQNWNGTCEIGDQATWDQHVVSSNNNNNNNNKQKVAQVIPIVIPSTGAILKSLSQSLTTLNLHPNTYKLQKFVILGTCSIVRNFLNYK